MTIQKEKKGSALSAFLKANNGSTRVLGKVERHIIAKKLNTSSGRKDNWIHPSQMVSRYWCHRASFFHILGQEPVKQSTNLTRELVFEQGHRIHDIWQTWFKEMGVLYGRFVCKEDGTDLWGLSSDLDPTKTWIYKEVPLENPELMITGHADGWLKGFGDDLLLEVKSIGVGSFRYYSGDRNFSDSDFYKAWNELKTPFESHISQAQVYLKLLELSNIPNPPQEILFVYESKVNQEVKEFIIPKSNFGITHLFDAAKDIVDAVEKGVPPVCNIKGPAGCDSCKDYFYEKI
jgi:hypothetical protein